MVDLGIRTVRRLRERIAGETARLQKLAEMIAALDALQSLADGERRTALREAERSPKDMIWTIIGRPPSGRGSGAWRGRTLYRQRYEADTMNAG